MIGVLFWYDLHRLTGRANTDAHRLTRRQPILAVDPLAVDAQFAFADHALDAGERQRRKFCLEKAVDPHAGFVRRDRDGVRPGGFLGKRNRRNDILQRRRSRRTWRSRRLFELAK